MLQIQNIRKSYTTGSFTQTALDDVSVNLRDSEFVAILGPSGSGKTTFLNIVGGLDRYDSGDLIIDGVSTKKYKDRDWDTYRNDRVGFVFQSYNLIPHQTVLQNVELALTLSGVDKAERTRRAKEALEAVGLGEHINKLPSQLSGGQMQRVAIARALINDPDILLADEPTGALDSKTSVQIMDLLKQIAHDRLVVMVTHNPELAEDYATRIVNLADGKVISDSDPYEPTEEEIKDDKRGKIKPTHMGFFTALGLSFNNLMTKKGRTIMTAFAGSIGIIGIAAILALANGVSNYITNVEENTLSSYPLQINSQGLDLASLSIGMAEENNSDDDSNIVATGDAEEQSMEDTQVEEVSVLGRMFDSVGQNDLKSLKTYLDENGGDVNSFVNSIQYLYNITPQIFLADTENGVEQINPDTSFSALGIGAGGMNVSTSMSTDVFREMLGTVEMAKEGYEVKAGHWPENYNECILVLDSSGKISDFMLYQLGLRDKKVLDEMIKAFINEEDVDIETEDGKTFSYNDFLNLKMKLVNASDYYTYDAEHGVWIDKTDDESFMKNLVDEGEELVISGIVQAKKGANAGMLSQGIYYTPDLILHLIDGAGDASIVKEQIDHPKVNVFNGKAFGEEDDREDSGLDFSTMFTIDEGAIESAFKIDASKLEMDMSGLDFTFDSKALPAAPKLDLESMMGDPSTIQPQLNTKEASEMAGALMLLYQSEAMNWGSDIEGFLNSPEAQAVIQEYTAKLFDFSGLESLEKEMSEKINAYMTSYMGEVITTLTNEMKKSVQAAMSQAMAGLPAAMQEAISFDASAFQNAFQFNMDEDELTELMLSMMNNGEATYENNLSKLGYADLDSPSQIDIFPKDFEAKQNVIDILNAYNNQMMDEGEEGKVVSYTDIVGILMKSVTSIINMISMVLIAFVSISLIVSSIMIGVITYISVLERKKEIGILRAIGASKQNISMVFNAETIIEGFIAGLLGVGITMLACIPVNLVVEKVYDVPNIAHLPLSAGIVLILISVFLTFIAGLIPARSASRKDPIEALRSE